MFHNWQIDLYAPRCALGRFQRYPHILMRIITEYFAYLNPTKVQSVLGRGDRFTCIPSYQIHGYNPLSRMDLEGQSRQDFPIPERRMSGIALKECCLWTQGRDFNLERRSLR